jgi:hypothetical protein
MAVAARVDAVRGGVAGGSPESTIVIFQSPTPTLFGWQYSVSAERGLQILKNDR